MSKLLLKGKYPTLLRGGEVIADVLVFGTPGIGVLDCVGLLPSLQPLSINTNTAGRGNDIVSFKLISLHLTIH